MTITPSEWALLRALALHRVMLVRRGSETAKAGHLLLDRGFLRVALPDPWQNGLVTIRITDAGWLAARDIEKELRHVDPE